MATKPPAPAAPPAFQESAEPGNGRAVVLESTSLFRGAVEIVIRHGGREYRLRRTRLDKLILTA